MKVADMHCDTFYEIYKARKRNEPIELKDNNLNISIQKMKKGDYLIQNFAMFTHIKKTKDPITYIQEMIDLFYQEIEKNKDDIEIAYSYQDIINHYKNHKMSALLTLEEGDVVNHDLSYLRNYYRLGVRMITLTWNYKNSLGYPNVNDHCDGYGVYDNEHGLTEFGIQYIQECERLGIIIDVSHLSDAGFYDVLKYTKAPFVASHSNVRNICNHGRNMTDDMIIQLASRGGVIGINYAASFLDQETKQSKVSNMVKHIQYIKNLVGIDYVGLGSDFDGISQNLEMRDCSYLPLLEQELYKKRFSKEEVEKIFYKNVLRLYQRVLK